MRICVLVTDAYGGVGGIAKYGRDLLSGLCAYPGCTEVVALPRLIQNDLEPLPDGLTYTTEAASGRLRYLWTAARTALVAGGFDLVICGHINLLPVATAISLRHRCPLLLIIYGIDAWSRHKSAAVNWLVGKVDGVVAISKVTAGRFQEWTGIQPDRTFILPNAVDIKAYGAKAKNEKLLERYGLTEKTVLMTMGRLSAHERYKGMDEIMEAMPALLQRRPDLAYLIAGDGDDRPRLERKSRALGLADKVVFAGFIPECDKADYYRLADVFAMPSRGEGFGFVFLEAMACGIPVVASTVDGSREAVRDGQLGVVVDPDDRDGLVAGIITALSRPRGEIPSGLDYFSHEQFVRRLHGIVEHFASKKGFGLHGSKN